MENAEIELRVLEESNIKTLKKIRSGERDDLRLISELAKEQIREAEETTALVSEDE